MPKDIIKLNDITTNNTNGNVNKNIISTTEDFPSFANNKFKVRIVDMYKNKLKAKKETLLGVNKFRYAMSSNRR